MAKRVNRLASLFEDFKGKFELPGRVDPDGLGADLGIPHRDRVISASYVFDPSEDSYEFGAALGRVGKRRVSGLSSEVLTSKPIRGITERIDKRRRFLIFGSRDGLKNQSDADIQKGYMDDVSRIARSHDQFREVTSRIRDKDG